MIDDRHKDSIYWIGDTCHFNINIYDVMKMSSE